MRLHEDAQLFKEAVTFCRYGLGQAQDSHRETRVANEMLLGR